jgi:hypothetical protein
MAVKTDCIEVLTLCYKYNKEFSSRLMLAVKLLVYYFPGDLIVSCMWCYDFLWFEIVGSNFMVHVPHFQECLGNILVLIRITKLYSHCNWSNYLLDFHLGIIMPLQLYKAATSLERKVIKFIKILIVISTHNIQNCWNIVHPPIMYISCILVHVIEFEKSNGRCGSSIGFWGYVAVYVQLYCRCFTVLHLVVAVLHYMFRPT